MEKGDSKKRVQEAKNSRQASSIALKSYVLGRRKSVGSTMYMYVDNVEKQTTWPGNVQIELNSP